MYRSHHRPKSDNGFRSVTNAIEIKLRIVTENGERLIKRERASEKQTQLQWHELTLIKYTSRHEI